MDLSTLKQKPDPSTEAFTPQELCSVTKLIFRKLNIPLSKYQGPVDDNATHVNVDGTMKQVGAPLTFRTYYDASKRMMTLDDLDDLGFDTISPEGIAHTRACVNTVFTLRNRYMRTGEHHYIVVVQGILENRILKLGKEGKEGMQGKQGKVKTQAGSSADDIRKMIAELTALMQPEQKVGGRRRSNHRSDLRSHKV